PDISIGATQAELGIISLEKYPKALEQRVVNASILASKVNQETWPVGQHVKAAWLKQKVMIRDKNAFYQISKKLQKRGYRVGNFNWPNLIDGYGKGACYNSMAAASTWVDVPIHQNLDQNRIIEIASLLNKASK
ncbi:MAG: hypothetical protein GY834_02905, partial [Bacteroidetes bacterium]|nr:hypothetical protein [Bacteroidota bacterium]